MRSDALGGRRGGGAGRVSKEFDAVLGFKEGGRGGVGAQVLEEGVESADGDVEGLFDQVDEAVGEGGERVVVASRGVS